MLWARTAADGAGALLRCCGERILPLNVPGERAVYNQHQHECLRRFRKRGRRSDAEGLAYRLVQTGRTCSGDEHHERQQQQAHGRAVWLRGDLGRHDGPRSGLALLCRLGHAWRLTAALTLTATATCQVSMNWQER